MAKYVKDERERKVLFGVHDRDYSNGELAENPSKLDYETLNRAYEVIRYYELLIYNYTCIHELIIIFICKFLIVSACTIHKAFRCHCQVPKVASLIY